MGSPLEVVRGLVPRFIAEEPIRSRRIFRSPDTSRGEFKRSGAGALSEFLTVARRYLGPGSLAIRPALPTVLRLRRTVVNWVRPAPADYSTLPTWRRSQPVDAVAEPVARQTFHPP